MQRVNVRAYERIRLGRLGNVCAHTRRWPEPYQFILAF
ncbi:hypothetical protein BH09PSE2_BH09PSE2_21590 [soil metagenome]